MVKDNFKYNYILEIMPKDKEISDDNTSLK